MGFAIVAGTLIGTLTGFVRGWTDRIIMAFNNALLAFPGLLLALGLLAVVGANKYGIILALGLAYTPSVTRIVRGTVLSLREKEFIESSRVLGNSELYTMWRHVLPNCIAPLTVLATSMFGWVILAESALSWAWACRRPRRPGATCWPPQGRSWRRRPTCPSSRAVHRAGAAGHQPAGRRGAGPFRSAHEGRAMSALVSVSGLTLTVGAGGREIVSDVSFSVAPGEMVGIVGESGSGKTQAARAIMGLTPSPLMVAGGSILFEGVDVPRASAAARGLRGARIGMVFQEPMTSLNPSMSIGRQLEEGLKLHRDRLGAAERRERVLDMLARVGIRDPKAAVQAWPHEFSGGMRQRMMLASVMLLEPALLIADEPTTALDAVVQRDVLELMVALTREHRTAVLMISHDLPMVARYTERMVVMQHGRVLEEGATAAILERPAHPYTRKLLDAMPRRQPARAVNREAPIVEVRNLVIDYAGRQSLFSRTGAKRALHGIDLQVRPREVVAVVGGSGSGKTTLGRAIAGLLAPSSGQILFRGRRWTGAPRAGATTGSIARWCSRIRIPRWIHA